jgi:hypothetical protein
MPGAFRYLPQQSGYDKRLRPAVPLLKRIIRIPATDTDLWTDTRWVVDSTHPTQHLLKPVWQGTKSVNDTRQGPTGPGTARRPQHQWSRRPGGDHLRDSHDDKLGSPALVSPPCNTLVIFLGDARDHETYAVAREADHLPPLHMHIYHRFDPRPLQVFPSQHAPLQPHRCGERGARQVQAQCAA